MMIRMHIITHLKLHFFIVFYPPILGVPFPKDSSLAMLLLTTRRNLISTTNCVKFSPICFYPRHCILYLDVLTQVASAVAVEVASAPCG